MQTTGRRTFLKSIVIAALAFITLPACGNVPVETAGKAYHHLVILGDPHLPGRDIAKKEQVLAKINSWEDVEMVVAVGDICADYGTDGEYRAVKEFFGKLHKPLLAIAGNHDYFYDSSSGADGKLVAATPASQQAKLRQFSETFGLPNHYYSRRVGEYLLVFLSADHPTFLAGMSDEEIAWLRTELESNKKTPTIIIFHGPLQGTLRDYKRFVNTPNFVAQPAEIIDDLLVNNQQVFLWVSGHTHTPPLEESYASPINLYAGRVTNIHNKDMNRGTIWTNSLFLYPDKVVVKTYNHEENSWLPQLERTFLLPNE
jgi:predicted phosphodiesterase